MSLRVLVVCAGNICRSPTAAAAIARAASEAGLEVEVDSAGTGAWNLGEPPHPQAVAAARSVGLEPEGKARRVHTRDFERYDVILAMDHSNLADLHAMAPSLEAKAKVRLFATYDQVSEMEVIADPYGGPEEGYTRMVEAILPAAAGLVESLLAVAGEGPVSGD